MMQNEDRLNEALSALGSSANMSLPDGFMDGVWMRAGQFEEVVSRRRRLSLIACMAFVGLGTGFGTMQARAYAEPAAYQLDAGADFSPAALLHVQP